MPMLRGFLVLVLFFILGESVRMLLALPVSGGVPRQLTFDSDYDVGTGWFPNSDSVLFTSYRDYRGDIFKTG